MNMRPVGLPKVSDNLSETTLTPSLRQRIETALESLLALLDTIDGDPDLEPSLGAPEVWLPEVIGFVPNRFRSTSQAHWSDGRGDLEEEEQHDAEDDPAEAGIADGYEL